MDIIDFKDGHATPKFWVLVNFKHYGMFENKKDRMSKKIEYADSFEVMQELKR